MIDQEQADFAVASWKIAFARRKKSLIRDERIGIRK